MRTSQQIGQRLLAAYDDMPRGERRLADLLLEDVGAIGTVTAGELAERAGVSRATAARLFRRLGYAGYKAAQREVKAGPAAVPPVEPEGLDPTVAPSPAAYLDAEVKHLVRTFELLRADEIGEAVRLLRDGQKLWVVGFGDGYPLAHLARTLLIRLRSDIRIIPLSGFPVPEEFASISSRDTVLALAIGRREQALRNLIRSAARVGAKVILVADTLAAGEKSPATVILRSRSSGPTIFGSTTSTASLLTYLCARLAARIGPRASHRLRTIEGIHAEWGGKSGSDA